MTAHTQGVFLVLLAISPMPNTIQPALVTLLHECHPLGSLLRRAPLSATPPSRRLASRPASRYRGPGTSASSSRDATAPVSIPHLTHAPGHRRRSLWLRQALPRCLLRARPLRLGLVGALRSGHCAHLLLQLLCALAEAWADKGRHADMVGRGGARSRGVIGDGAAGVEVQDGAGTET